MNLSRRIKKEYWGEKFERLAAGEEVDLSGLTLEVSNWIIAEADAEDRREAEGQP